MALTASWLVRPSGREKFTARDRFGRCAPAHAPIVAESFLCSLGKGCYGNPTAPEPEENDVSNDCKVAKDLIETLHDGEDGFGKRPTNWTIPRLRSW